MTRFLRVAFKKVIAVTAKKMGPGLPISVMIFT
jgi:hypothetical protein